MKKELQEKLFKKYPSIFARRNLSKKETAMCYGISCGDGWYFLIDALCEKITDIIRMKNIQYENFLERENQEDPDEEITRSWGYTPYENVSADQVKSKFGTLRFYLHNSKHCKEIKGAIAMAEKMSQYICEDCGNQKEKLKNHQCKKNKIMENE